MKKFFRISLTTFLLATLFSGCLKDYECNYDPCSYKAPAAEITELRDYLTVNNITATEHCSGLFYRIENMGNGKDLDNCGTIQVKYKGKLKNGTVFEERTDPIIFELEDLIPGWKNALPLIKAGGKIHIYIPPSLGYGNQAVTDRSTGAEIIPANSMLIMEIELVAVL